MTHAVVAVVIAMVTAACGCGCGSQPVARTTFLRSVDLIDMTDRMAESFANDPVLGRRGSDANPWVISVDRVVNYTNQIIPQREKWLYLARLRALLAESEAAVGRNIIWTIPPQRWPMVAQELGLDEESYGLRLPPTHLLTAEFHALTNTSGAGRSDMYLCNFQLLHLSSGTVVWEEKWEVKRAVSGLTYD